MTGHRIELSLETDSGVSAHFVCEEPADSWCHESCEYGCEIFNNDCMANHPRELTQYCNPIEFVDNGGMWWEQYIGEETEPRSGSIIFEWQSDWYGWRYDNAEAEAAADELTQTTQEWTDPFQYEMNGPQPGFWRRWLKTI